MEIKETLNKLGIEYIERPVGRFGTGYKISGKNMTCEIIQFGSKNFRVDVEISKSGFTTDGQAIIINRERVKGETFLHINVGHFNKDGSIDSSNFYIEED